MEQLLGMADALDGGVAGISDGGVAGAPDGDVADAPDGGVAGPNTVQQAILLWTFQTSAHRNRVCGIVGEGWDVAEDPFAPTIHRLFNKATISAPLLW